MKAKQIVWPVLAASLALAGGCNKSKVDATAPEIAANTIYTGGDILTMEGDTPQYVEAVAVKDGKIVFVGGKADADKFMGAATTVHDLQGKALLPGFIDTHVHWGQFVLLSAICVQKPLLAFQQAKLAFETALVDSGLDYSIVRPTAFFKSLSGQVERVKRGKPFLVFGDGTLTSCKPIDDDDLADYLADCLDDASRHNRVLPIGGPGAAITPRQQGERLFALLGRPPRFRQVPVAMLDAVIGVLGAAGRVVPALAGKADLARIGRYYATESMLVLDPETGRYDAAATPSTGTQTLFDYYERLLSGATAPERGDHAVF